LNHRRYRQLTFRGMALDGPSGAMTGVV
jgi:hypothetical protein